jgi:hypothetical protein
MKLDFARTIHRSSEICCPLLAERYLRLYTRIAQSWSTPALPGLLRKLILVDRPMRRGFSVDVMRELLALVHAARCEHDHPGAFDWFEDLQQNTLHGSRLMELNTTDPLAVVADLMGRRTSFASHGTRTSTRVGGWF